MGNWFYLEHQGRRPKIRQIHNEEEIVVEQKEEMEEVEKQNEEKEEQRYDIRVLTVQSEPESQSSHSEHPQKMPVTADIEIQSSQKIPQIVAQSNVPYASSPTKRSSITPQSQIYIQNNENHLALYKELIISESGGAQAKKLLQEANKKTMLLWLKQDPKSQKQQQREVFLQKHGYQVQSFSALNNLLEYCQQKTHHFHSLVILYSYSTRVDSDFILRQLYNYFIQGRRVGFILVVKPASNNEYTLRLPNLQASERIKEVSYPVELIRRELGELTLQYESQACLWGQLNYWASLDSIPEMLASMTAMDGYRTKGQVMLRQAVKVGRSIIESSRSTQLYKQYLYQYLTFHDIYLQGSSLLSNQNQKSQAQLNMLYLSAAQSPAKIFLLQPSYRVLLNRVLRYNLQKPAYLHNIMLPLALLYEDVKEQHEILTQKSVYKHQFVCYWQCAMTEWELKSFIEGKVYENMGFIRARTHQRGSGQENEHNRRLANVQMLIRVPGKDRLLQYQPGYCLIQAETTSQSTFQGYQYIIFNLFNTFLVTQHTEHQHIHTIHLQYGYIPTQLALRAEQNYIPQRQPIIKRRQTLEADLDNIIRYESRQKLLSNMEDWGDAFATVGEYQHSNNYYEGLERHQRQKISENNQIKAKIDLKKIRNYQNLNQLDLAISCCFNSITLLTSPPSHTGIHSQLQQIYLITGQLLLSQQNYNKMTSFGENLLRNKSKREEKGNKNRYSAGFMLQFYQLLAEAYLGLSVKDFVLCQQEPRISKYYQLGMKIVEQLGQYHELVPKFYLNYARWQLISRQPWQSTVYFNKAILILTTINSQRHPILCEYYQWAAVACSAMHDHEQALKNLTKAIKFVQIHQGKQHNSVIELLELAGKCLGRMGRWKQAEDAVREEVRLLELWQKRNKGKIMYLSQSVGAYNRYEQINKKVAFDKWYRESMKQLCPAYCLIYLAHLQSSVFQYSQALSSLNLAQKTISQNMHHQHRLLIQVHHHTADIHLKMMNIYAAKESLARMWRLIGTHRAQQKYPSISYYLKLSELHEYFKNLQAAYESMVKARQVAFNLVAYPLLLLTISDDLVLLMLKLAKVAEARRLVNETKATRKSMLRDVSNQRQKIKLFGADLDDYQFEIRLGLCRSAEQQGLIEIEAGNKEQGKKILYQCLQNLLEEVGQYHPDTARLYHKLGTLSYQLADIPQAYKLLHSALSIYSSDASNFSLNLVSVHISIAKVQQQKNELVSAVKHLTAALAILHPRHKFDREYLVLLKELNRLIGATLEHRNENYVRAIYFVASQHLQRCPIQPLNEQLVANQAISEIRAEIQVLMRAQDRLRQAIIQFDPKIGQKPRQSPSRVINMDKIRGLVTARRKSKQKTHPKSP